MEDKEMFQFALLADSDLNQPLGEFADKVRELINSFMWLFVTLAAVLIVAWGAYVGIKYVIAQRNEQKVEARDLIKQLIIGSLIIAAIIVGGPLLVKGLAGWMGTPIEDEDGAKAQVEYRVNQLTLDEMTQIAGEDSTVFTVIEPDF